MDDNFNLQRFVEAQDECYEAVLEELRAGHKQSHWMWYIFPQIAGLGDSIMTAKYAISCLDEAKAYLEHPILGPRLRECTELVLKVEGRTAEEIFSRPDNLKFRSCMTLFEVAASDASIFRSALVKYFGGEPDKLTLNILERAVAENVDPKTCRGASCDLAWQFSLFCHEVKLIVMRIIATFLLLLLPAPLAAQEQSQWQRVYTYEDAVIEMEVIKVSFGNYGRVKFRTVFDELGPMGMLNGIKYKSSIEDIQFDCGERVYRITEIVLLDPGDKIIHSIRSDEAQAWKVVESNTIMERMFDSACRMIAEKKL